MADGTGTTVNPNEAFCAAWCEKHCSSWQVFRKGAWKYRWHGKTLVRYVDAVQVRTDELAALLDYLSSDACLATLSLNKQGISGDWKPVNAWYEINNKPNGAMGGVRLYHALMVNPTNGDGDGPHVVENGCQWNVKWTFFWKQESVITLTGQYASTSGVNYRITNLSQDDETGLYSYVLERRERVQQDIAEYETARTSFETRKEEQHLGVKQDSVASAGKQASVSDGKTITRRLRKNDDCTTDVINETTQEEAVSGAVTETIARLRGTETTIVNRNMAAKASENNLPVGTSVRNEKTDGGRWTQTIRSFAASVAGKLRVTCRKTIFRHVQAETTNVANDPGFQHVADAGGGVVRETDVQKTDMDTFDVTTTETREQSVQGAVTETRKFIDGTVTRTVNRNQSSKASEEGLDVGDSVRNEKTEGGCWDQTIERSSAEPAGVVGETCENTALVHSHARTTGMGKVNKPTAEVSAGDGTIRSKRVRKTDRGAWEVTSEDRTAKPATAEADGGTRNRTVHVVSYRNAQEVNPGSGGENEEIDVSLQRNEFGLVDGTVRRTTYAKTMGRSVAKGAMRAKQSVTVTRNDPDQEASEAPAKNKTVEVSVSPNDHGTFDKTVRVTDFEAATEVAFGGTMLYSEERTVSTNTEDNATRTPTKGTVYDVSAEPNDHGTKRLVVTRRTAIAQFTKHTWTSVEKNAKSILTYNRGVFVYQNQQNIVEPEGSWDSKSLSGLGVNQYGLLDYVWSCNTLTGIQDNPGGGGGNGNIRINSEKVKTEYYTNVIVKDSSGKRVMKAATCEFTATRTISTAQDFDGVYQQYLASEEMAQVGWRPEFHSYNGHYVAVAYKGITAVGQNGQKWRLSDSGVSLEQ